MSLDVSNQEQKVRASEIDSAMNSYMKAVANAVPVTVKEPVSPSITEDLMVNKAVTKAEKLQEEVDSAMADYNEAMAAWEEGSGVKEAVSEALEKENEPSQPPKQQHEEGRPVFPATKHILKKTEIVKE